MPKPEGYQLDVFVNIFCGFPSREGFWILRQHLAGTAASGQAFRPSQSSLHLEDERKNPSARADLALSICHFYKQERLSQV